ncbi:hypothetical protein CFK44_14885 [Escherichia coli O157]|uniref:hypothetical protein n=1 Tax=Escherichia coli TaxID=562 RepID=UPI00092DBA32|nr:hypothetical protein [Escherichia coli]APK64149.1 hypothetical protein RG47_22685 [Escherichia coli]APK65990.1 hypothetical protein RG48_07890 [Escherichia coli]EFN8034278.1 hypothetical protein [Escherichia coli]EHE8203447.1 hypothetical protein [Escherichia coli]EIQ9255135.1 hypothetical protein [Escherichia coli]
MSTITKKRAQEIFLGNGPEPTASEERELARIALASLEAEAVAYIIQDAQARGLGRPGFLSFDASISDEDINEYEISVTPLYTAPQLPQPAVAVVLAIHDKDFEKALSVLNDTLDDCGDSERGLLLALDKAGIEVRSDACRAAILQGDEPVTTTYKSPDDFICMLTGRAKYLREKGEIKSPELLERAAAALQEESVNTPPIPNGWKLVPIDPTKDMLRAGQSVVGFWLNTVHCYSKMLAAAPAAPQQEADNG